MPNQALLVATLVELADNLVDEFDVVDLLSLLSDRCVEALDVSAAGVMLAAPSGNLEVIASSSETMRALELFQLQADQGPCVDAFTIGQPVVNVDLDAADGRWPHFVARALDAGFRSAHSIPMRLRGRSLGALNLLNVEAGPFEVDDVTAAHALADVATIAIVQHRVALDAQTLNNQLNTALTTRVIIEQAKGKIAQAAGVDMDGAFRRLRAHARNHRLLLSDVAELVANGTMNPLTFDPLPGRSGQRE